MATSAEAAAVKSNVPSLAEQAEQKIFKELAEYLEKECKQSVFAVGGSIPITSLSDHLICESDDADSESGSNNTKSGPKESDVDKDSIVVGSDVDEADQAEAPLRASESGAAAHKMRCDPVTIRWDSTSAIGSSYKVTLPCPASQRPSFEQLLKDCQPATFGLGGKDVLDETYRKAGKLDETDFCTNFSPYALGIIDTAAQALAPNNCTQTNETHGVRAELYKLNVYAAPSGKFKAHVDTPRSKHQIGSLVVCLPCVHEGGQLVLRHQGQEKVFDWSGEKSSTAIQWAAFYSDCEHEVLEVTSGERVTLTYNLYATCSANTALIDPERVDLYHTLKRLLENPGFCKNGVTLGYHCVHAYAHTSRDTTAALPATLKGVDKVIYACFRATKLPVRLRHVIAMRKSSRNQCYEDLLERYWTEDPARVEDLKPLYQRKEQNGWGIWKLQDKHAKPDFELLADGLVLSTYTRAGLFEDHQWIDILDGWTRDISVKQVRWLNTASHKELALVHGAYGNEASLGTLYSRLVITLDIPPFQDR
ncbi:hypothetical protein AYL99_05610 [Fonsecaea erecta]|uniref:Fe2OG dioxygenase domain-containing protein n=1 Tax=Fonsecaea erecta TaxID=1367422 RepID=A0A178ZLC8_9EURO|nr:hypothetical protein AYL99_05610 [Fonsecaea erecta]OAP60608.1 hypothetical protein AYL99_05610 [Fonsecaea erecta]